MCRKCFPRELDGIVVGMLVVAAIEFEFGKVASIVVGCCEGVSGASVAVSFIIPGRVDGRCERRVRGGGSEVCGIGEGKGVPGCVVRLCRLVGGGKCSVIRVRKGDSAVLVRLVPTILTRVPIEVIRSRGAAYSRL